MSTEVKSNEVQWKCPWCGEEYFAVTNEIACQIFRCGYNNGTAIPPHTSKEECERLAALPTTRGCCKPFKFDGTTATKLVNADGSPNYC